ncbi:MAG: hypothetical protein LC749_07570, partial [Actinobacteria bacterium]|nr:hypothetical protein [Actinomycetota bacterium]
MLLDLTKHAWVLTGWRPFQWLANLEGFRHPPDVGPIPAFAPGSVLACLQAAGIVNDPLIGLRSRDVEWLEHRHWEFSTSLPAASDLERVEEACEPAFLEADGLDYGGWVYVDDLLVAEFGGVMLPHRFNLGPVLADDAPKVLRIIFREPPPEQGVTGWTSRSLYFKPRYSYGWDWCPRLVPTGIWGGIR